MPTRVNDATWIAFQKDIDVSRLNLPPWGGVVQWADRFYLVYICQNDGTLCRKGEVMLSDVTDRADLIKNIPRAYDPNSGLWVYQFPAAFVATLAEQSKAVLETTGQIIKTVAETAGGAAGALTKPLLDNLSLPLIVIGVVLALVYIPKPRGM